MKSSAAAMALAVQLRSKRLFKYSPKDLEKKHRHIVMFSYISFIQSHLPHDDRKKKIVMDRHRSSCRDDLMTIT